MQCRFMQCATVLFFSVSCRIGHSKAGHSEAWQSAARRGCFDGLGRMFAERAISR